MLALPGLPPIVVPAPVAPALKVTSTSRRVAAAAQTFDATVFTAGGAAFDGAQPARLTPPRAGTYLVGCSLAANGLGAGALVYAYLSQYASGGGLVDSTPIAWGSGLYSGGPFPVYTTLAGEVLFRASAGDYFTVSLSAGWLDSGSSFWFARIG